MLQAGLAVVNEAGAVGAPETPQLVQHLGEDQVGRA